MIDRIGSDRVYEFIHMDPAFCVAGFCEEVRGTNGREHHGRNCADNCHRKQQIEDGESNVLPPIISDEREKGHR